jgi:hypothetical protein
MGYVLEVIGAQKYAKIIEASLPEKLRQVPLQSAAPSPGTGGQMPWLVEDNINLKESMN